MRLKELSTCSSKTLRVFSISLTPRQTQSVGQSPPKGLVLPHNWLRSRTEREIWIQRWEPDPVPNRRLRKPHHQLPALLPVGPLPPEQTSCHPSALLACAECRGWPPPCSKHAVVGTWQLKLPFSPPLWHLTIWTLIAGFLYLCLLLVQELTKSTHQAFFGSIFITSCKAPETINTWWMNKAIKKWVIVVESTRRQMTNAFTVFYAVQAPCKCHSNIVPVNPQGRTTREVVLSLFHRQENKGSERGRNISKFTHSQQSEEPRFTTLTSAWIQRTGRSGWATQASEATNQPRAYHKLN